MNPYRHEPNVTVQDVQVAFARFAGENRALLTLDPMLRRYNLDGWVFGGALRDVIVDGEWARPRDIDVVVTGDPVEFQRLVEELALKKPATYHFADGGEDPAEHGSNDTYTVEFDLGTPVELWHINDQRGVRGLPAAERTIQKVAETTFLTSDSILARIRDRQVVDAGALAVLNNRVLDCRPEQQADTVPLKSAVKAIVMSEKLGLKMTDRLRQFCGETLRWTSVETIVQQLQDRYGGLMPMRGLLDIVSSVLPKPAATKPVALSFPGEEY